MRTWLSRQRDAGQTVPTLWSGMEISALLKGVWYVLALGFELDHGICSPTTAVMPSSVKPCAPKAWSGRFTRREGWPCWRIRRATDSAMACSSRKQPDSDLMGVKPGTTTRCNPWRPSPLICEAIDRQLADLGPLRTCGTDSHGIDLCGR